MTEPRNQPQPQAATTRLLALALLAAAPFLAQAQTPTPTTQQISPETQAPIQTPTRPRPIPAFYRNLIFIDPAHGATDPGANLPGHALEKDVTLAFAARLRPLLADAGFTVISSRDADPANPISTDQRADVANHARPLACIILHATTSGTGIHIATSALAPDPGHTFPLPWDTAQSASIPQSLLLANLIGVALLDAHLPVLLIHASIPPLDNLTCPAIALELAPLATDPSNPTPAADAAYQQQVAGAIASALTAWRTRNSPPPATPAATPGATR